MQYSTKSGTKDKQDVIPIVSVIPDINNLSISGGKYYRFDEPVNTLNIKLPTIGNNINRLENIVLFFTTGDNPAITFSADSDIAYFMGYSIEPNTTYEINLMFNRSKWIVSYGIVE